MSSSNGAQPVRLASPYSTRFKIIAGLIVATAAVLSVVAYLRASDARNDSITSTGGTSEIVEELIPPRGSQALQQATVGIDLASGWQGALRIDGKEIPEDQLSGASGADQALNRIEFTPGSGKVIETLPPGQLCVQAVVWEPSAGREAGTRTVSWCFEVV